MAVSSSTSSSQYSGNGSASEAYPTGFPFLDEEWVRVEVTTPEAVIIPLELGSGFVVTGAGHPEGGEITTVAAWPADHTVTIYRSVPLTQLLDLEYNDRLPAALVEQSFDKLTYIVQEISNYVASRAIILPRTDPATAANVLPPAELRRDTVLAFNALTGEPETLTAEYLAQRILELYGLQISSADVLAAMSAIAPLIRASAPGESIPGKTGQLAVVPGGMVMEVSGSLSPAAGGTYVPAGIGEGGKTTYATGDLRAAMSPAANSYSGGVLYYTNVWVLDFWAAGVKTGAWLGLSSAGKPFPSSSGITWTPAIGTGVPAITQGQVDGTIHANLSNELVGSPPQWVRLARASDGLLVLDTGARLGLTYEQAYGQIVVQEDGSGWFLVALGDPSNEDDWIQIAPPADNKNSFLRATDYGVLPTNTAAQNDAAWALLWAVARAAKRSIHFDEPATYLFSAPITINQSGITLSGANREFTRLQWNGTTNGINIELGGDSSIWGNQTRRVTFLDLNIYGQATDAAPLIGRGINIHDGSVDNVGGTLTGQAVVMNGCTLRNWDTGYWNRRCDQSSLIDCVIVYNRVGIEYETSVHSLILTNTGIARQKEVGIIARSGSGNVIIGGDFGNQPRNIQVFGPQPLTIIGTNHESCLTVGDTTGTEFIRIENNARLTVIGCWFLRGLGLDVPRFRMMGVSALNLQGYSDSGNNEANFLTATAYRETGGSIVVGLPSFTGLNNGVTVDSNESTYPVVRCNLAPWKTIYSNSALNGIGGAAISGNRTENDLFTVLPIAADNPSHLIWHSPVDKKVHRLSGMLSGTGTPQGNVSAMRGTLYLRTDGGTSTTLYVKETGDNTNTGWVAK
jgi:hypothetical protein